MLDPSRPERVVKIGAMASEMLGDCLPSLLREFSDVFAFEVEEMQGIDPDLAVQKLAADPN